MSGQTSLTRFFEQPSISQAFFNLSLTILNDSASYVIQDESLVK